MALVPPLAVMQGRAHGLGQIPLPWGVLRRGHRESAHHLLLVTVWRLLSPGLLGTRWLLCLAITMAKMVHGSWGKNVPYYSGELVEKHDKFRALKA